MDSSNFRAQSAVVASDTAPTCWFTLSYLEWCGMSLHLNPVELAVAPDSGGLVVGCKMSPSNQVSVWSSVFLHIWHNFAQFLHNFAHLAQLCTCRMYPSNQVSVWSSVWHLGAHLDKWQVSSAPRQVTTPHRKKDPSSLLFIQPVQQSHCCPTIIPSVTFLNRQTPHGHRGS